MGDVAKEIEAECREHFNEPVLSYNGLARLIGYYEDAWDVYYTLRLQGGQKIHSSACGGVFFLHLLKEQGYHIDEHGNKKWSHFDNLDKFLALNGVPKEAEFLYEISNNDPFDEAHFVEHKKQVEELYKNSKPIQDETN